MPNVSVIMSTYKEDPALVEAAVDSILNQTYSNLELLVVIDCPDNYAIHALLDQKQQEDGRVVIIRNEENLGLAMSLNKALRVARGQFICRMDADDISMPNRIESQLAYLTAHDLDLIGGRMTVISESGDRLYDIPQPPTKPESVKRALRWNNCVPHPTWFGKATVFEQAYRTIPLCEDYDFLLRASMTNCKIGNCDEIVLKYRMTSESVSRTSLFKQFLYQRFITKEFKKGSIANLKNASIYVVDNYSDSRANRYAKANNLFNEALVGLKAHKPMRAVRPSVQLLFCSANYLNKILRLIMVSIIS